MKEYVERVCVNFSIKNTLLHYNILYYTVLCYTMLHYIYRSILYNIRHSVEHNALLCVISYSGMLYFFVI